MTRVAVVSQDSSLDRLSETLEDQGFGVTRYPFPGSLLWALYSKTVRFDLIVLDRDGESGVEGMELCKALRKRHSDRDLPIVLLTDIRGPCAEANAIFRKPVDSRLVLERISQLLGRSQPGRLLESQESPSLPFAYGNYRVVKRIGRSLMATVYLAFDDQGRQVVLRIMGVALNHNPALLTQCARDALLLKHLRAAHLAHMIDCGFCHGRYYLVTERIRGIPSSRVLLDQGPLPERGALLIGRNIAMALSALHGHGLVHDGVKPANVILGDGGRATLVDLGLPEESGRSGNELIRRTPDFVAPEVLAGEPSHAGSDLYALGVTLYRLLTGKRTFPETTSLEAYKLLTDRVRPMSVREHRSDLTASCSAFVDRLVDPNPLTRLSSADQAARELNDLLHPSNHWCLA